LPIQNDGGKGGEWESLVLKEATFSVDTTKPNIWCQEFAGRLEALKQMHRRLHTRLHNMLQDPLERFLLTKRRQAPNLQTFQESLKAVWERWTMKEVRDFARVLSDLVPDIVWLTELTLSAELGILYCSDFFNQDLSDQYVHFELKTATQPNNGWRWPPLTPVLIDPYKMLQKLANHLCLAVHHWTSSANYSDQPWNLEQLAQIVRDSLDHVLDGCLPLPIPKERELIDRALQNFKEQQSTHAELMHLLQHRQPWLTTLDCIWKTRTQQNQQLMEKAELQQKETDIRNEAKRELKIQERNWQQRLAQDTVSQVNQVNESLKHIINIQQQTLEQQAHLAKQIAALNTTFVSFGTHMFSTINASIKPTLQSIAQNTSTRPITTPPIATPPPPAIPTVAPNTNQWPAVNWTNTGQPTINPPSTAPATPAPTIAPQMAPSIGPAPPPTQPPLQPPQQSNTNWNDPQPQQSQHFSFHTAQPPQQPSPTVTFTQQQPIIFPQQQQQQQQQQPQQQPSPPVGFQQQQQNGWQQPPQQPQQQPQPQPQPQQQQQQQQQQPQSQNGWASAQTGGFGGQVTIGVGNSNPYYPQFPPQQAQPQQQQAHQSQPQQSQPQQQQQQQDVRKLTPIQRTLTNATSADYLQRLQAIHRPPALASGPPGPQR
jgi:hypothetical protein